MNITEFFFAFHKPAGIREIRAGASFASCLGHVEAFGYTDDDTWFFFDPGRKITSLYITHLHDEVNETMAEKFTMAREIIAIKTTTSFSMPFHMPMNCVTQCAALVGMRAFTPNGFRRKLLANEGVIVHGPQGRPGR